jgi:hypothetical protein
VCLCQFQRRAAPARYSSTHCSTVGLR